MGKLTISMGHFNSYVANYRRGNIEKYGWLGRNLQWVRGLAIARHVWLPESVPSGKQPQFAIENGPFIAYIADLPMKNSDFPVRKLLVYRRVTIKKWDFKQPK